MEDLDGLLDDLALDDDEEQSKRKVKAPVMSEEEKLEKRRLHFQKARRRAKANKRAKGVKRDYTWKDEPLESIAFSKPTVVIDLTYADRMRGKEVVSVANQVQQCYGRNRKAAAAQLAAKTEEERIRIAPPIELHLIGLHQPALAPVFSKHEGFDKWKVFKHDSGVLTELFDAKKIVILSPESSNVLEEIDRDAVYVIGGISDNQNDMKGTTLLHASKLGLAHARLPLLEYCPDITTRGTVLNINHCFEILLLKAGGFSWVEAIDKSVPTRASFRTGKSE